MWYRPRLVIYLHYYTIVIRTNDEEKLLREPDNVRIHFERTIVSSRRSYSLVFDSF